ncbi:MAG: hypothetical protein K8I29_13935 [Alphaproteobacteria bacterium]|uniref:Phosphoenolpyruvate synthase n=1 Tax=Candidatus Nitrobium versatile TaxID=2884831 RepID=A0A953JC59_9BACT|nr:hypothetical protein [Candidatus Nitrobium versatile]
MDNTYIRWFENLSSQDVLSAGGKNASPGEMIRSLKDEGIRVPDGFATTAGVYWEFIDANGIRDKIGSYLTEWKEKRVQLDRIGASIRRLFQDSQIPKHVAEAILNAYREICRRYKAEDVDIAVRK